MLIGAVTTHPNHNLDAHSDYRTKIYKKRNLEVVSVPHNFARIELNQRILVDAVKLLLNCDALVTIPDWYICPFAKKIVAVAREIGITVISTHSFLLQDDLA